MPWTPPTDYIPAIYVDLFPADVEITPPTPTPTTTTRLTKVRVISTRPAPHDPSPRLYIFHDTQSGPDVHTVALPTDIQGSPTTGYQITLADPFTPGTTLTVTPTSGCGCGSRLRGFVPFSTMRYTA